LQPIRPIPNGIAAARRLNCWRAHWQTIRHAAKFWQGFGGRGDTISDPITNLHCAPNGNIVNGQYAPGADGFNLADVSSVSALNALPAGVKRLVWLKHRLGRHRVL